MVPHPDNVYVPDWEPDRFTDIVYVSGILCMAGCPGPIRWHQPHINNTNTVHRWAGGPLESKTSSWGDDYMWDKGRLVKRMPPHCSPKLVCGCNCPVRPPCKLPSLPGAAAADSGGQRRESFGLGTGRQPWRHGSGVGLCRPVRYQWAWHTASLAPFASFRLCWEQQATGLHIMYLALKLQKTTLFYKYKSSVSHWETADRDSLLAFLPSLISSDIRQPWSDKQSDLQW